MTVSNNPHAGRPARLLKKGTATTKTHRFEPFSQRIVKLKIDPIHRVRQALPEDDDNADISSHFRSALEHWVEMNLSENFTKFAASINPLCESLPQIIHHEDEIMGLLVEYIEKRDELCMEPLLSLVAQFARDLGQRFEKHFATAITLVASVAATHPSVEVIEWSFTCLAWILKFLSRLLVPDLCQFLGIMSPYLGKSRQKHFVTRFAAESMSFLVRKASIVYYKNQVPLDRAVSFLLKDLAAINGEAQSSAYKEGLMSMFSEAMKGVKTGLYSNATDILAALIKALRNLDSPNSAAAEQVLYGVFINLIHSTVSDTFAPLIGVVCNQVESEEPNASARILRMDIYLLFLAVTTRKGTRVQSWKGIYQSLTLLLKRVIDAPESCDSIPLLLGTIANSMQTSPMDELLPPMRTIMDGVSCQSLASYFIPFCSFFASLGSERFQSIVLPYFQK